MLFLLPYTEGVKKAVQRYKSLCVDPINLRKYPFFMLFYALFVQRTPLETQLIDVNNFA